MVTRIGTMRPRPTLKLLVTEDTIHDVAAAFVRSQYLDANRMVKVRMH